MRDKNEIELYYIYAILGRLRSLVPTTIGRLSINQSMFPKRFVYKLINDRLSESVELAEKLAAALFRRLLSSEFGHQQQQQQRNGQLVDTAERQRIESITGDAGLFYPELEEYFHCTLCNVHDFLVNLDWHELILEDLPTKSDSNYIKSKLPHLDVLIQFRKLLVNSNALKTINTTKEVSPKTESGIPSPHDKATTGKSPAKSSPMKSNLSKRSPESPGPRRRVRFNDSKGPIKSSTEDQSRTKKYIRDSHSILALDLMLFSLNLFVKELKRQLLEWSSSSTAGMKESMQLIRTSKRKLRVNRLILMARDREVSNTIHANILNNLVEVENTYLLEHVLYTICAQDDERLLRIHKRPHVRTFVNEFIRPDEKEVLNLLVTQILEILFELAVCEINIPPMELTGNKSRGQSKEVNKTNQENYVNLVASWLNLGEILFGPPPESAETAAKQRAIATKQVRGKSAGTGFDFKSSSRILNQMDNLHELVRHILSDLVEQLNSKRHVEYCLHLLHRGMGHCLELISQQLNTQLSFVRKASAGGQTIGASDNDAGHIDKVAIKIRYLKLIHICSSMDSLIKELLQTAAINVSADSMLSSGQLSRLIDESTKQMESI